MIIKVHRRICKAAVSILLIASKNYRKPFSRRNFSRKTETDTENDSTLFLIHGRLLWA